MSGDSLTGGTGVTVGQGNAARCRHRVEVVVSVDTVGAVGTVEITVGYGGVAVGVDTVGHDAVRRARRRGGRAEEAVVVFVFVVRRLERGQVVAGSVDAGQVVTVDNVGGRVGRRTVAHHAHAAAVRNPVDVRQQGPGTGQGHCSVAVAAVVACHRTERALPSGAGMMGHMVVVRGRVMNMVMVSSMVVVGVKR